MITKEEIDKKAENLEVPVTSVQKDYIFGWILFGLFTHSNIRNSIFLKGGNAIRKGYIRNTRFSSDLDFGIEGDISEGQLLGEINRVCAFVSEVSGVKFLLDQTRVKEKFMASETPLPNLKVFEARVYFEDFYGGASHIRLKIVMDFTRFDKALLPIQNQHLIHDYADTSDIDCTIRCMKLEEIIATKLKCLTQRQHAPDMYDYVHSIKLAGGEIDKYQLARTFIRKTIFGRNPHIVKDQLRKGRYDYLKEFWVKGVICAKTIRYKLDDTLQYFISSIDELFAIFPEQAYASFSYFPGDVRVKIMEAGRTQTLMKVTYNGADRIIEPYSLKYMQKKSGDQREYFYVFNLKGGSSPPGVRSFVASNLQSIENTEEKFEPRYQIELAKSGELPENPYLFDPRRPTKSGRRYKRNRRTRGGIKYVYRCPMCGKEFKRSTRDSVMRKHKNPQGLQCSGKGRGGFYVTMLY